MQASCLLERSGPGKEMCFAQFVAFVGLLLELSLSPLLSLLYFSPGHVFHKNNALSVTIG